SQASITMCPISRKVLRTANYPASMAIAVRSTCGTQYPVWRGGSPSGVICEPVVEIDTMLARLLPQSDDALIVRELARMGYQTPEALLRERARRLVWKCIGVPCATATVFLDWLQQQGPGFWGYSTAGAEGATQDLLCGAPATLLRQLQRE